MTFTNEIVKKLIHTGFLKNILRYVTNNNAICEFSTLECRIKPQELQNQIVFVWYLIKAYIYIKGVERLKYMN